MVRICGIVRESVVDGPGLRFVLFTQGCPHRCPGCHNPQSHDPEEGYLVSPQRILEEFDRNPLLQGMTLSGGEPLLQPEELLPVARGVRERGKDLILYTGYTVEELLPRVGAEPALGELLTLCSTLIDGRYLEAERDLTLLFRGSRNQRVIDPAASLGEGRAVEASFPTYGTP